MGTERNMLQGHARVSSELYALSQTALEPFLVTHVYPTKTRTQNHSAEIGKSMTGFCPSVPQRGLFYAIVSRIWSSYLY